MPNRLGRGLTSLVYKDETALTAQDLISRRLNTLETRDDQQQVLAQNSRLTDLGLKFSNAIETYLFMKWNWIDLMLVRNPTDADEDGWEEQWRNDVRTVAARFDKVSVLLSGHSFDSFLVQNGHLLTALQTKYQSWKGAASFKDLFVKELFHK